MSEQPDTPAAPQPTHSPVAPAPSPKKGFAVTALVLGIVAIIGSWIPILNIGSILIGIVGLVFGIIATVQAFKGTAAGKVMAIVGASLSAAAILFALVVNAATVSAVDEAIEDHNEEVANEIASSADTEDATVPDEATEETEDTATDEGSEVAGLVVVDSQVWRESGDSGYWNYYVLVENPSTEAVYTFESFDVELVDADGVILDSTTDYPTVLPGTEIAIAGTFFDSEGLKESDVAGIEVLLPESPSQLVDESEVGTLTVSDVAASADTFGVDVEGVIESSFVEDQETVEVTVVAFDGEGNAVAQDFTFVDRLPAGGKARFDVSMWDIDSPDGLTFKAWANL